MPVGVFFVEGDEDPVVRREEHAEQHVEGPFVGAGVVELSADTMDVLARPVGHYCGHQVEVFAHEVQRL